MSVDSIGPCEHEARSQLLLGESVEPGILIADPNNDGTYTIATAAVDAAAITMNRYDANDTSLPDGFTPVKLIAGEGELILTTDEATVGIGELFWQAADGKVSKTPSPGLLFEAVQAVAESGTKRFRARLRHDRSKPVVHVVTAAEASANAVSGISTGFGSEVRVLGVPLVNNAIETGWAIAPQSDGTVNFSATSLSDNDVVSFVVSPSAA
ncbi:MAG: hypothetical protein AAFR96_09310 [Planctomycetota bacterium]